MYTKIKKFITAALTALALLSVFLPNPYADIAPPASGILSNLDKTPIIS